MNMRVIKPQSIQIEGTGSKPSFYKLCKIVIDEEKEFKSKAVQRAFLTIKEGFKLIEKNQQAFKTEGEKSSPLNLILFNFDEDLYQELKLFITSFKSDCVLKLNEKIIYDEESVDLICSQMESVRGGTEEIVDFSFESQKVTVNVTLCQISLLRGEQILREIKKDSTYFVTSINPNPQF